MMRRDELTIIISAAIEPLARQIASLETRTQDLATRGDLEKLRAEILNGFVQSSALEPRLEAIRQELDRMRGDMEAIEKDEISEKDRRWIRAGQIFGYLAFIISVLSFFLQHVHIS